MPGLRDIGRITRDVAIRGENFTVSGFAIGVLADLLGRSQDLEKLLAPGVRFDAGSVIRLIPQLAQELAQAALGAASDDEKAGVANLTPGEIALVLETAWDLSFPNGLGRLKDWAGWLMAQGDARGAASGSGPAGNSSPGLMN